MKFKLIENYDYYTEEARLLVQEYAYDAIDELKDASFDIYFKWFLEETHYVSDPAILKQAVKDFYIEAVDSGKINQPKTMTTRALKDYLKSHKDIIDDTDELMKQCPEHLQHELKLVINTANLNESLLEELPSKFKHKLYDFIKQNQNLLNNNIDDLYLLCPVGLKRDLVDLLKSANIRVNTELINKFEFLVGTYTLQDLDRIVIDHEGQLGTTTDNVSYIIRNWNKFDFPEYKELNEEVLTEDRYVGYAKLWSQFNELIDIGLDKDMQKTYELHHINPTIQRSKDGNTVNYVILPREVHKHMPSKNNPVELYNELKTEFSDCFKTINVSFDVLLLTEEVKQEILNKIKTYNMRYKREQDKLRKRALRQKMNDNK